MTPTLNTMLQAQERFSVASVRSKPPLVCDEWVPGALTSRSLLRQASIYSGNGLPYSWFRRSIMSSRLAGQFKVCATNGPGVTFFGTRAQRSILVLNS